MGLMERLPQSFLSWKGALLLAVLMKLPVLFRKIPDPWSPSGGKGPRKYLNNVQKLVQCNFEGFVKYWHGYEMHDYPQQLKDGQRNTLLIGYHSRCTVDIFYVFCVLKARILVSSLFFKVPVLRGYLAAMGVMASMSDKKNNDESFVEAITAGGAPLMLLPGGIFEAFKQYDQRYKLNWKDEPGFARAMVQHREEIKRKGDVFVVPFFTSNAEDTLFHSSWTYNTTGWLSNKLYDSLKSGNILMLPLVLSVMVISFGFIFIPTRAKLETHFGDPLTMTDDESAQQFAARVRQSLQNLMDKVNSDAERKKKSHYVQPSTAIDAMNALAFGFFVLLQNTVLILASHVMFMAVMLPVMLFMWIRIKFLGKPKKKSL